MDEIRISETEIVRDQQYESQVDIAKRYPRDLKKVVNDCIAIATMDKETAETCNFSVPRGGKEIQGASVYLARIIVQQYGNIRVESRVTGSDAKQVHAEAVCFDLEKNTAVKSTTSRAITYKNGGRYNEDLIILHGKVAAAIAYRNAVFDVIPKAITNKVYNAAINMIAGDLSTEEKLIKRRKDAIDVFKDDYNVSEEELLDYLGLNTTNQIKQSEIVTMIGMFNSLKDGEFSVESMFGRKKTPEAIKVDANEFKKIISDLKTYKTGLNLVQQKYKDSELTEVQKAQIEEAGTITTKRLDEIIKLVLEDDSFDIKQFELILTDEQLNEVQEAIVDKSV